MATANLTFPNASRSSSQPTGQLKKAWRIIVSVDVEEHHRIEAAAGTVVPSTLQGHYSARVESSTRWLVDLLAEQGIRGTFFLVGQLAHRQPGLVKAIHRAGHEVASHGWDHRRVHHFTPSSFAADLRQSRDVLEQIGGEAVVGYRAPTFSIGRDTSWAIDTLAEQNFQYDSSIYPVRHDRYGVPDAPRYPFLARGFAHALLELPPATLCSLRARLPVGGGGYFRLLPLFLLHDAISQLHAQPGPRLAMLYFHPWEFDPRQARLPLRFLSGLRTYVGISRSRARLRRLLGCYPGSCFTRAKDVAARVNRRSLRTFNLQGHCDPAPADIREEGDCKENGLKAVAAAVVADC
jgi:polysaccharide deacetylase family protein (PEP-CTERM system associated)